MVQVLLDSFNTDNIKTAFGFDNCAKLSESDFDSYIGKINLNAEKTDSKEGTLGDLKNKSTKKTCTAINNNLNDIVSEILAETSLELTLQENNGTSVENGDLQTVPEISIESNVSDNTECLEFDSEPVSVNSADKEGKTLKDLIEDDILEELNVESVESEFAAETQDSGENTDFLNSKSPEEHGMRALINSNSDSIQDFKSVETESTKVKADISTNGEKILEQITKQMEGLQSGSRVNIVLNPERLGKVALQLINTAEGLSAQLTVSTKEARELIMKDLESLKSSLLSQGVNVDSVNVKLNESQSSEYQADWTEQEGSRGGFKHQGGSNKNSQEQKKFERAMFKTQEDNQNGNV